MKILAFVESRSGEIKSPGLESISAAKHLAEQSGGSFSTLVVGQGAASIAEKASKFGAESVYAAEFESSGYSPEYYCDAVLSAMKASGAEMLVMTATLMGRDLAAMAAAALDASFIPDCTELNFADGKVAAKRPVYAGRLFLTVAAASLPAVVTVRPKAFKAAVESGGSSPVQNLTVASAGLPETKLLETKSAAAGKLDVTEADVIVSGGRGLKDPANWHLVEELAASLGAAVGASRAVVDAGWRPHGEQVGQTGKVVGPTLYIACGISGAIQHLAGMRFSKTIVAINKDPEAPIFKVADYGLVGDALEVLPALTAAIRAARQ